MANRHYIPGCAWPITHRCHKKEFLLKFARDQRRWLQWLFEAKKRFEITDPESDQARWMTALIQIGMEDDFLSYS